MKLKKRAREVVWATLKGFFDLPRRKAKLFNLEEGVKIVFPLEVPEITKYEITYNSDANIETIKSFSGSLRIATWTVSYNVAKDITDVEKT